MSSQDSPNTMVDWAEKLATSLLPSLGNRWLHVQRVVANAHYVGQVFDQTERSYLLAAAYTHDIGYAPSLKETGFHPLDGAYYLKAHGYERLASLVAYHSEAQFEAQLRGMMDKLEQFPREQSPVADALIYCDLTAGPTGVRVSFEERIEEVFSRYGENDIVTLALRQAKPSLALAIENTQKLLRNAGLASKV